MTKPKITKRLTVISLLTLLLLAAAIYLVYSFQQSDKNYAEDVAKPLEEALVKAGATKICDRGDDGQGSDNRSPNYSSIFKTNLTREATVEIILQAAREQGYSLERGDSAYKEIANYYDHSTKINSFDELEREPTELSFGLYNGGSFLSCVDKAVESDGSHTAIKLDISLPKFK